MLQHGNSPLHGSVEVCKPFTGSFLAGTSSDPAARRARDGQGLMNSAIPPFPSVSHVQLYKSVDSADLSRYEDLGCMYGILDSITWQLLRFGVNQALASRRSNQGYCHLWSSIELCLHCLVLLCRLGDLSGLATQCQTSDIQNQSATSDCYWLNFIQGNNFSVEVRESFVDYSINMNLLYPSGSNAPAPLTPESQYEVFCYAQDDWSIQATCQNKPTCENIPVWKQKLNRAKVLRHFWWHSQAQHFFVLFQCFKLWEFDGVRSSLLHRQTVLAWNLWTSSRRAIWTASASMTRMHSGQGCLQAEQQT